MYSVVNVNTENRTLALSGRLSSKTIHTFLQEYLQFKRGYENEFDFFYDADLPINSEKGWPFLNEQAVLMPKTFTAYGNPSTYEVEQRLEIIEIYFKASTLEKVTMDARTNFVTKMSMIGGMLGLFTGFSVISGVEIIYFFIKVLLKMYTK